MPSNDAKVPVCSSIVNKREEQRGNMPSKVGKVPVSSSVDSEREEVTGTGTP
jgi:hypothetical protein